MCARAGWARRRAPATVCSAPAAALTAASSRFAQDASFAGGSLGEAHADTVVSVLELAERSRVPVIGFVESAGARMQEGLAALSGYGRIFHKHVALSGRVPQISVICGPRPVAAPMRRR
jgi:acetyl-CoA carboxylase carboxyltransferase component